MNKLIGATLFVAGALIGSSATWLYVKDKYEKMYIEDVASIRKKYKEYHEMKKEYEEKKKDYFNKDDVVLVKNDIEVNHEDVDYTKYKTKQNMFRDHVNLSKEEQEVIDDTITIISAEEFAANDEDYEVQSLTYYADGHLIDEYNEIITNVEDVVGYNSLNLFDTTDTDCVFVKNDNTESIYEILRDLRDYSDVHKGYN